KVAEKRSYYYRLYHGLYRAYHEGGAVMIHRSKNSPRYSAAHLQVVDSVVDAGLAEEVRAVPGSDKASRLLPREDLIETFDPDPWAVEAPPAGPLVTLRDRDDKTDLPFDPTLEIVQLSQALLTDINAVNANCPITAAPEDEWDYSASIAARTRTLRPVFFRLF